MKRLLALAFLLLLPGLAQAETCTFAAGTSTWSAVGTITGAGVTGCTPTLDDAFVVPSGATVNVTGSITQNSSGSLTVQSGGTLNVSVSAVTPVKLILTIGSSGLNCQIGSSCTFAGRYRSWGVTPATTYADPVTTAGSYFQFGDPWPCATSTLAGCTAGAKYKVDYSIANKYGNSTGALSTLAYNKYVSASLTAITAGDYVCLFDPNPGSSGYVGADVNNCYEVTTGGSGTSFQFDPRQGSVNQSGYPLARRDVPGGSVLTAVAQGGRDITINGHLSPDLITRDTVLRGRWIRFQPAASSGAAADSRPYKIMKTVRGGTNDVITIGDVRGVARAIASGEQAYIDYGWEQGDPFFVLVPVVVTTATVAEDTDSPVRLRGTVSINGAVFRDTCVLNIGADSQGLCGISVDSDRTQPTITSWKNLIVWDMRNGGTALELGDADNLDLGLTNIVGGSSSVASDTAYRLTMNGSNLNIHDWSGRYPGDDCFNGLETGSYERSHTGVTWTRMRCAWTSDNIDSGNFFDIGPAVGFTDSWKITDSVCDACSNAGNDPVFSFKSGGGFGTTIATVTNSLAWGTHCGFGSNASGTFSNLLAIGVITDATPGATTVQDTVGACSFHMAPSYVDGFVVRDAVLNSAALGTSLLVKQDAVSVKNGIFNNTDQLNTSVSSVAEPPNAGIISNVAFIDNKNTGRAAVNATVLLPTNTATASIMQNLLFAQTTALSGTTTRIREFLYNNNSAKDKQTFSNIAFYNLVSTGATRASANMSASSTYSGSFCFYNTPTLTTLADTALPVAFVADQAPNLVDAAWGNDGPTVGGLWGNYGCGVKTGVQAPGIRRYLWMHKISKIQPEFFGVGTLGGGGGSGIPSGY